MGLLDSIKADVRKAGSNKSKFIYFREGEKKRIRFLQDMDEGMQIKFHDHFDRGINCPCQEQFGRDCEYCDDDDLRTRDQYCWSVWDYDENEVKLFMFAVNRCSPIPPIVALYEQFGTLLDRDYVITVQGKQLNKTYTVIPMDKAKFRNQKAKPYSEDKVWKMLDKAFPDDNADDDDKRYRSARHDELEDDQSDYDDSWDDEDDVTQDYLSMKPMELYKLCRERKIEAMKKKPAKYYINLLEEDDKVNDDWGDEDDNDEWEDDDE